MPKRRVTADKNALTGRSVYALHPRDTREELDPRLRSIVKLLARQAARAYYEELRREAHLHET